MALAPVWDPLTTGARDEVGADSPQYQRRRPVIALRSEAEFSPVAVGEVCV